MVDLSVLDEMQREWFKQLIESEIEESEGTISNERLWQKGSDTKEQVMMHEENIIRLNDYAEFLRGIIKQLN